VRLRYVLPPIVSIRASKFPNHLRKSSPLHEQMEIGQGEATISRLVTDRMGGRLAERFSSAASAARAGLLAQIAKKTGLERAASVLSNHPALREQRQRRG
jgi:hypothetical protein